MGCSRVATVGSVITLLREAARDRRGGDARPGRAARWRARGPRARGGRRAPSSTSPMRRPRAEAFAARPAGRGAQLRGVDGRRRRRDAPRAGARGQRRRRGQPRARRRAAGVPLVHVSSDYVFDGEACVDASGAPRPVRGVRPDGPALGLRPEQARGRAAGAWRLSRATRSCAARGCSGSAGATSRRRCSGSPTSARRCRW